MTNYGRHSGLECSRFMSSITLELFIKTNSFFFIVVFFCFAPRLVISTFSTWFHHRRASQWNQISDVYFFLFQISGAASSCQRQLTSFAKTSSSWWVLFSVYTILLRSPRWHRMSKKLFRYRVVNCGRRMHTACAHPDSWRIDRCNKSCLKKKNVESHKLRVVFGW